MLKDRPSQTSEVEAPAGGRAITLTPTQSAVRDKVERVLGAAPFVVIVGGTSSGKTVILEDLHRRRGGRLLTSRDLLDVTRTREARRYEHSVYEMIMSALDVADVVFFDDAGFMQLVGRENGYARWGLFPIILQALKTRLVAEGKTLVVSEDWRTPREQALFEAAGKTWFDKSIAVRISAMQPADLQHILEHYLGAGGIRNIDLDRMFTYSHGLGGGALEAVCRIAKARGLTTPSTAELMEILSNDVLRTNVNSTEVEKIDLEALVGVEDLIERLDRTILLPLREPNLAKMLGLKAKHGVLLHGPPGTGKTTIGRALAHMMKGRFFMIDGDLMHDDPEFFDKVDRVFQEARRNMPSVIFIDDADVILGDPSMQHFGRYLLTKLDGLQSQSAGEVCVMMTAMDLDRMPRALLRSGRLEVWLETKAPEAKDRADMMRSYFDRLALRIDGIDFEAAAEQTSGFTAADMRRLADDVLGYVALERRFGSPPQSHADYFARAVAGIRKQKTILGHLA